MNRGLTRRTVLGYAATSLALSTFTLPGCRRDEPVQLADALRLLVDNSPTFTEVGRAFLNENPTEDTASLTAWLTEALEWLPEGSGASLGPRLANAIRSDFTEGRTLPVSNWILSETEARWTALHALTMPAAG